jgi:hypothetical protein
VALAQKTVSNQRRLGIARERNQTPRVRRNNKDVKSPQTTLSRRNAFLSACLYWQKLSRCAAPIFVVMQH